MAVSAAFCRADEYRRSTGAGLLRNGRGFRYPLPYGRLPRPHSAAQGQVFMGECNRDGVVGQCGIDDSDCPDRIPFRFPFLCRRDFPCSLDGVCSRSGVCRIAFSYALSAPPAHVGPLAASQNAADGSATCPLALCGVSAYSMAFSASLPLFQCADGVCTPFLWGQPVRGSMVYSPSSLLSAGYPYSQHTRRRFRYSRFVGDIRFRTFRSRLRPCLRYGRIADMADQYGTARINRESAPVYQQEGFAQRIKKETARISQAVSFCKAEYCQCASSQLCPTPQSATSGTESVTTPCISSNTSRRTCSTSFSGTLKFSSSCTCIIICARSGSPV